MEEECCAICLSSLQSRQRKLHTTECGHVFHETCFEKIKGDLTCPCCRAVVQPLLKQQIRSMDDSIRDMAEYVRMFPAMYQSYMSCQNAKIAELEQNLREAKERKRIVHVELTDSHRHNKLVLEKCKATKKAMVEQQRAEHLEYQKKRAETRAQRILHKKKKETKPPVSSNASEGMCL